jgi:hypothetical protein
MNPSRLSDFLLILGLSCLVYVAITFGLTGVPMVIALSSSISFYISLICIPVGLVLKIISIVLHWIGRKNKF